MSFDHIFDSGCTNCKLCESASSVCIGNRGNANNLKVIFFGESPGDTEDKNGVPFIGKAGNLLDQLLEQVGADFSEILFSNIVRCFAHNSRTPRPPTSKEVIACIPYTYRMLDEIYNSGGELPTLVALGNVALSALTGKKGITKNRGIEFPLKVLKDHWEQYGHLDGKFKVMGIIHPSADLRTDGSYRSKIVADLDVLWKKSSGQSTIGYDENYVWVDDPSIFEEFVNEAIDQYQNGEIPWVAYDLETESLETYNLNHKTVAFSVCKEDRVALVVPLHHKDSPWRNEKFIQDRIISDLERLLNTVPICGWNLSFDIKWTWLHLGIGIGKIGFDGLLGRKWINPSKLVSNDLNTVMGEELGYVGHGRDLWAEINEIPNKEDRHMGNVSKELLLTYSGGDADATFQLCKKYKNRLEEADSFENFEHLLLRGLPVVCEMEVNGVWIDPQMNSYLLQEYPKQMEPLVLEVENTKWGMATKRELSERVDKNGKPRPLSFNFKSPNTIQNLVFKQMGLPSLKSGATGPSTDREVIEELVEFCQQRGLEEEKKVLEKINEWRALSHTYTNFIKNMKEYTAADGFFHTQYNILGTESGRWSSYKPSIHGQPKGSQARWQFASRWQREGGLIVAADFAQQEMRVLASVSGDENLIEAIKSGTDLHTANASRMFGVPTDEVTKEQRDRAKRAGFGVVYGIGAKTLASRIETSTQEAQNIIDAWYKAFPMTLEFQREQYSIAKKYGFVFTSFGRTRNIDGIDISTNGDRAWRQSINMRIQSEASDLTFCCVIEIFNRIKELGLNSKLFGFVHDSIIVDVAPGELVEILDIQYDVMVRWCNETFEWLLAPVSADFEIGPGWGFPCTMIDREGNKITISGDIKHTALLGIELNKLGAEIISRERKDKNEEVCFIHPGR